MQSKSSFLPSDEQIYERSKNWSNFFSRIVKEEDFQEVPYENIEEMFDDEEEEDDDDHSEAEVNLENTPENGCKALVKVEKFEASSESSDDFDDETLLNETRNIIEERKRKWKESGMDRVLDTFDFNAITEKVGSWLRNTKTDRHIPSDVSLHEVHYENHQYELNSDESFQSADTAKYILSNRKPRAGSCTKMIIKRFRYVKGKRKELQTKYNSPKENDEPFKNVFNQRGAYAQPRIINRESASPYDFDECRTPTNHRSNNHRDWHTAARSTENVFEKNNPYRDMSGLAPLNAVYKTPKLHSRANLKAYSKTTSLAHEAHGKHKSRFRKRRSDMDKNRSMSRSSSCNSDRSITYTRPRFRKLSRKTKKSESIDLSMLLTSSSDDTKQSKDHKESSSRKEELNAKTDSIKVPNSDVTCFLPDKVVNSTAIAARKSVSLRKKSCELSPVKNTHLRKEKNRKDVSKDKKDSSTNRKSNTEPQNEPSKRMERKESLDSKHKDTVDSKRNDSIDSRHKDSIDSKHKNFDPKRKDGINLKRKESIDSKRKDSIDSKRKESLDPKRKDSIDSKPRESIDSRYSPDSKTSDKRIMLYTPKNEFLYNESISDGHFILTEEHLKKLVGKRQAQRFITFNGKKFPLKFDLSSTVYFMLPADSENSHRSGSSGESDDEDVLNMFGKQGSLVEQTSLD